MKRINHRKKIIVVVCGTGVAFLVSVCSIVYAITPSKLIRKEENHFSPAEIDIAVQENNDNNELPTSEKKLTWTIRGDTATAPKEVQIKNRNQDDKNNADAYIRVCLIPQWYQTMPMDAEGHALAIEQPQTTAVSDATRETTDVVTTTMIEVNVTNLMDVADFGDLKSIEIKNNTYQMGDVTLTLADDWETYWFFNPKDGYFYCRSPVAPGKTTALLLKEVSIPTEVLNKIEEGVHLKVDVISDAIQTEGGAIDARWADAGVAIYTDTETNQSFLATRPVSDEGGGANG